MPPRTKIHEGTTIPDRLKNILTDILGEPEGGWRSDTRFCEDAGADSLDRIELVIDVEWEFETVVPDKLVEEWATFGQVVQWLESKGAVPRSPETA